MAQHGLAARKARAEVVDIGLAHRCLGPEHPDDAAFGECRGGLDGGDGADDRQVERGADMRERDRRGGVAGDDSKPRLIAFDKAAEQGGDARRKLCLAFLAIGQPGIVGSIDDRRSR